jgi:hypothetical protein
LDLEILKKFIKGHPDETPKEVRITFGVTDAAMLYKVKSFEIPDKKSSDIRSRIKGNAKNS